MMQGREKSDLAIVAAKPANNDGQPSAEPVERRAGAEGNAGQDRTCRAQDRESVSQGLDRVRHVAKSRKTERFTTLLHHVTPDLLRTAFFALRRSAAPGVDGLTWQTYEADLDRRIEDLHERVHRGAYRALPARRGFIPKADGSRRPLRTRSSNEPRRLPCWKRQREQMSSRCHDRMCALGVVHSGSCLRIEIFGVDENVPRTGAHDALGFRPIRRA